MKKVAEVITFETTELTPLQAKAMLEQEAEKRLGVRLSVALRQARNGASSEAHFYLSSMNNALNYTPAKSSDSTVFSTTARDGSGSGNINGSGEG